MEIWGLGRFFLMPLSCSPFWPVGCHCLQWCGVSQPAHGEPELWLQDFLEKIVVSLSFLLPLGVHYHSLVVWTQRASDFGLKIVRRTTMWFLQLQETSDFWLTNVRRATMRFLHKRRRRSFSVFRNFQEQLCFSLTATALVIVVQVRETCDLFGSG